jgi:hypothetical protein
MKKLLPIVTLALVVFNALTIGLTVLLSAKGY